MNRDVSIDALLRDYLAAHADTSVGEGQLSGALAAAMSRRQRPAWLLSLTGASMGTAAHPSPRVQPRRLALIVAAGLLLALAVAIALVGAQQRRPLGANGLLAFSRDGDILVARPDGSGAVTVVHGGGLILADPLWAPGGRYIAFREEFGSWYLVDVRTLEVRPLGAYDRVIWSPDGSTLAVTTASETDLIRADTGARRVLLEAPSEATPPGDLVPSLEAWSPDGRWLAAVRDEELVRIDVQTGAITTVATDLNGRVDWVAWSPDSQRMSFADHDCPQDGRRCSRALAVISADGSGRRVLTPYMNVALRSAWSADGAWIAYTSGPAGSPGQTFMSDHPDVSLIRPDGSESQRVAEDVKNWAWAPDGKSVLYTVFEWIDYTQYIEGPTPVWAYELATGEARELGFTAEALSWQALDQGQPLPTVPAIAQASTQSTPLASPEEAPSTPPADPSGSGSGLGFDTGCQVVSYDFATAAVRPIADEPGCAATSRQSGGAWAPDGSAIFVQSDDRQVVISRDGRVLLDRHGVSETTSLSWSSGGRYLLESTYGDTQTYAIVRPDGSGRVAIESWASWSPDDSRLAIRSGSGQLLVGNGDGSGLRPVGDYPAPVTWSPDSQAFAFIRDGQVWVVRADGSEQRQVTRFALGGAAWATWSPDGRWIAVTRGTQVWLVSADGAEQRLLGLPSEWRPSGLYWSPDGGRLAVTTQPARNGSGTDSFPMFLFSVGDGSAFIVPNAQFNAVWSPDSRYIAVTGSEPTACQSIAVLNADGSGKHTVWSGDCGLAQTIAWLP